MLPKTQQNLVNLLGINTNTQPTSIAAPIEPNLKSNPFFDYLRQDPIAEQVTGGDPLKKLLRFAATMIPGISTDLARYEGDKLGEALSYVDYLGAAALPIKAAAKGVNATTDLTKDLMFLHNLREDALKNYANIGGLPSPSIAVMQKDVPLQGYGDVTLVGKPEKFDPSLPNNPVYSADAFTPRAPKRIRLSKNDSYKEFKKDYEDIFADKSIMGSENNYYFDTGKDALLNLEKRNLEKGSLFNPENRTEEFDSFFSNSKAAKIKFLKDTGRNPKEFIEPKYNNIDLQTIPQSEYIDWVSKQKDKYLDQDGIFTYFDEFSERLETVPYTAENVAKNMVADTQRGGEAFYANSVFDNPVSNAPSLARALLSKDLKSLDDIKANKNLLYTTPNPSTYDLQGRFEDTVSYLDDLYKSKGRDINTEELIDDYFQFYKNLGSHEEVIKKYPEFKIGAEALKDFIDEIEFGKRRYFEAKPTRVVNFDEFAGAIVNENIAPETLNLLKSLGLKIEKYDPYNPMARTEARNKFQDQMFNMLLPTAAGAYGYNTINSTEE